METHFIPLITLRNLVLTPKPNAPRLSLRIRTTEPRGPRPRLPKSHPTGQTGRYEKEGVKTRVMSGQKQGNRYGASVTEAVRLYSLIQRNYLHGVLPTELNYYIFYYKYYCSHSTTSPETPEAARFHPFKTLEKRNGYLKGVATMEAQQKNMELLAFSCSRDSSWLGAPLPRYGRHGRKKSHQTL